MVDTNEQNTPRLFSNTEADTQAKATNWLETFPDNLLELQEGLDDAFNPFHLDWSEVGIPHSPTR